VFIQSVQRNSPFSSTDHSIHSVEASAAVIAGEMVRRIRETAEISFFRAWNIKASKVWATFQNYPEYSHMDKYILVD
jgi:hypothetical protein